MGSEQPLEGHTVRRFDGELNQLHLLSLEMGGLVLNQIQQVLTAMQSKDLQQCRMVIERDREVNQLELKLDDGVITVIARRGPVARDLRAVMALSKIVTDLERIGDEAARIAHICLAVYDNVRSDPSHLLLRDVHTMGRMVVGMVRESLLALDDLDGVRARRMMVEGGDLEQEFQAGFRRLVTYIMEDPRNVGHAINAVLACKALERIGDHARSIAEYVVYLREGEDLRHSRPEDLSHSGVLEANARGG